MDSITSVMGWVAAVLLIGGYALVAFRVIDAHRPAYHVINLIGSGLLVWYSYVNHVGPQVVLNLFWGAVALVGIVIAIRAARSLAKSGTPKVSVPSASSSESVDEPPVREG